MLIISMMPDDVKISCGPKCTTFISNGIVYMYDDRNLIPLKQIFNEMQIGEICYGEEHIFVIEKFKKEIYGWGANGSGQLGLGDYDSRKVAQKITFNFGSKITSISCGAYHTLVITELGELYGWGRNYNGRLGLGDETCRNYPRKLPIKNVKSVSCGFSHTMILTSDGRGYSCGANDNGQLGLGNVLHQNSLQKLDLSYIILISCGGYHTFVLTCDGIYSFGLNGYGQLGLKHCQNKCTPQKNNLSHLQIISIKCGSYYSMILTSEGKLFSCGYNCDGQLGHNREGQLGLGNIEYSHKFQLINLNEIILSVSCGDAHTVIMTKSRKYYSWGSNKHGQLGLGDKFGRSGPTEIMIKTSDL